MATCMQWEESTNLNYWKLERVPRKRQAAQEKQAWKPSQHWFKAMDRRNTVFYTTSIASYLYNVYSNTVFTLHPLHLHLNNSELAQWPTPETMAWTLQSIIVEKHTAQIIILLQQMFIIIIIIIIFPNTYYDPLELKKLQKSKISRLAKTCPVPAWGESAGKGNIAIALSRN